MSEHEHDSRIDEASGSGAPDAPGSGVGTAPAAGELTGAAQAAANDVTEGLQQLGNSIWDTGEAGFVDALKIVDSLQSGVSKATTAIVGKATGTEVELPTIPTAKIGSGLTDAAQQAANRVFNGLETLANEAFDLGEEGLTEALKIVDEAQKRVTGLLSHLAQQGQKIVGPPKG
jgi:hypothetical protein